MNKAKTLEKNISFGKKIMEFWNIFFFAFNVTSSKPLTYRDKPLNDKFFERHCIKEKTRVAIYFWQKKLSKFEAEMLRTTDIAQFESVHFLLAMPPVRFMQMMFNAWWVSFQLVFLS